MLASAPTGKLNTPRGVPGVLRTGYMGNAVASSYVIRTSWGLSPVECLHRAKPKIASGGSIDA